MNTKRPLWIALVACITGSIALVVLFPRYWPAAKWTVLPQNKLAEKAHQISQHFGLDTSSWKSTQISTVAKSLANYSQEHPGDANARALSPLSARFTLTSKPDKQKSEAGIDSAGLPIYWKAPEDFKPAQTFASADEAASDAFRFLAGQQAGAYNGPIKSAGDESHEEEYVWKKPIPLHSEVRERIRVVTHDSAIKIAEHKLTLASSDSDDSDSSGDRNYWDVLNGIFGVICSIAMTIIAGIFILWFVRKVLDRRFHLRMGLAALILIGAMSSADPSGDNLAAVPFGAVVIACILAVGRAISLPARPKWMTLEQLCLLAPRSKAIGTSLLAGVLFSPLLLAVPFMVVACGLIPQSFIVPLRVESLYSSTPVRASLNISQIIYLLALFGFVVPVLRRMLRVRVMFWPVAIVLGTLCVADWTHFVTGPIAAPLTTGTLILAVFWFVYASFDLLALLVLQFASGLLLTTVALFQKGMGTGMLIPILGCLVIAGFWFLKRGQLVSEGDPSWRNPPLTGFRAEREKLKAEFSLARRAQQDMLPQTPPDVPGYSIAASCTPSLEVGGDLYDFLKLPDGRIGLGVADVSGKGVPAALYMTLTKGLLSAVAKNNSQLSRVVEEVNRHLHGVTRKKVFVTMALGFLDTENRMLECVRAGHNPVVWRQPVRDVTTLVAPGGLGLGITAGRVFGAQLKVAEMPLLEGDAVVFYSDGITEAMNSDLEQFGEQRLMDAVQQTDNMDAAATRDSIIRAVKDFLGGVHAQDDMTLVVLRVGAAT